MIRVEGRPGATCPPCVDCGGPQTWEELCACRAAVEAFVALMLRELGENAHKGGRRAWCLASPSAMLGEVHHHVAKLHVAVVELDRRRQGEPARSTPWGDDVEAIVREFGADVANMALMLLDCLGLLGVDQGTDAADQG